MGSLAGVLAEAGVEPRQLDLFEKAPESLPWNEVSGLVVLGGTMSANDGREFPFLLAELDWLREAVRREVPTLGICLGAQLLAKALGAEVYRNSQREIGWYQVEVLPAAAEDRLFFGRGPAETVFHWHNDTFDLPAGAVHLAQSSACSQQAFRVGNAAYGLQFHVEMVPELMELWLREFTARQSQHASQEVDAGAIRAAAAASFPGLNSFSLSLLKRFAELCRQRA
jgi:GMP synthase (glutamine-hydrolysing)